MDTEVSGNIEIRGDAESLVRSRDVIKKAACGVEYIVMGIEDQGNVHYAMPLRNMIYDSLGYLKEYKSMTKEVKTLKSADEFLSQMGKGDRLHPIITLTVYYGEKPWDGPKALKDMVFNMPAEIESVFSDYSMNLIEVRSSGKYIFHNEDVRMAFEVSRNIFEGNIDSTMKEYGHVPLRKEVWNFISAITDIKEFLTENHERESENMCEALQKWAAEKIKQVEQAQQAAQQAQQAAKQAQQAAKQAQQEAEQVQQAAQQMVRQLSEEARAKGMKQGIEQGIEQSRRDIVKNMFRYGLPWETVAEMTGLSGEEVKAMKEHQN